MTAWAAGESSMGMSAAGGVMTGWRRVAKVAGLLAVVLLAVGSLVYRTRAAPPRGEPAAAAGKRAYVNETFRGKVVWMAEALRRRFEIRVDDDVSQSLVALETESGELLPIVKDARGRGFHLDERLHDVEMEIFARRFDGSPMLQVLKVYTIKDEKRYELDYWCDTCAIAMFELKACECCQGPTRIRERLAEKLPENAAENELSPSDASSSKKDRP